MFWLVRTSRVSVAVRLCGDVLALAFAIALVRPGWAHGILWILCGVASFAVMGLYAKRIRMTALDDLAVFVGSAVGVAAMSLSRPGGVRVAVAEAVLGDCSSSGPGWALTPSCGRRVLAACCTRDMTIPHVQRCTAAFTA